MTPKRKRKTAFEILTECAAQQNSVKEIDLEDSDIELVLAALPASQQEQLLRSTLKHTESLNLRWNKLNSLLPSGWVTHLLSLTDLDLGHNLVASFTHDELLHLTRLRRLVLDHNRLESIPPEISRLSSLEFLDLSKNKLISLPDSIGHLPNLVVLYADDNLLDTLPHTIGGLTKLEELRLDYNRLVSFPTEFASLRCLRAVYARHNRIYSRPAWLNQTSAQVFLDNKPLNEQQEEQENLRVVNPRKVPASLLPTPTAPPSALTQDTAESSHSSGGGGDDTRNDCCYSCVEAALEGGNPGSSSSSSSSDLGNPFVNHQIVAQPIISDLTSLTDEQLEMEISQVLKNENLLIDRKRQLTQERSRRQMQGSTTESRFSAWASSAKTRYPRLLRIRPPKLQSSSSSSNQATQVQAVAVAVAGAGAGAGAASEAVELRKDLWELVCEIHNDWTFWKRGTEYSIHDIADVLFRTDLDQASKEAYMNELMRLDLASCVFDW